MRPERRLRGRDEGREGFPPSRFFTAFVYGGDHVYEYLDGNGYYQDVHNPADPHEFVPPCDNNSNGIPDVIEFAVLSAIFADTGNPLHAEVHEAYKANVTRAHTDLGALAAALTAPSLFLEKIMAAYVVLGDGAYQSQVIGTPPVRYGWGFTGSWGIYAETISGMAAYGSGWNTGAPAEANYQKKASLVSACGNADSDTVINIGEFYGQGGVQGDLDASMAARAAYVAAVLATATAVDGGDPDGVCEGGPAGGLIWGQSLWYNPTNHYVYTVGPNAPWVANETWAQAFSLGTAGEGEGERKDEANETRAQALTFGPAKVAVASHLATVDSAELNAWLVSNILSVVGETMWIGGTDQTTEGVWRWIATGGQFWEGRGSDAGGYAVNGMYTHWNGTGEPSDAGGEDYAEMYTNGGWNDNDTGTWNPGIVEFTNGGAGYPDEDHDGRADYWEPYVTGSFDNDGDGMPNGWENLYGLDQDDPADAAGDLDSDGLTNLEEYEHGTIPTDSDTDNDGLTDGAEVNTYSTSPTNTDSDGLSNLGEFQHGANPGDTDSDDDGLTDGAEVNTYGSNPTDTDSDDDGLNDGDEVNAYGTSPTNSDTDGDGMPDPWEIAHGLNPLVDDSAADADSDGLNNLAEYLAGTDPGDPDSDDDGLTDGAEVNTYWTNPMVADTDGDGLSDSVEVTTTHTNPNEADTDGDGIVDGIDPHPLHSDSPWRRYSTAPLPSARSYWGMVYDSARQVVVMWGDESQGSVNITSEFNGASWQGVETMHFPPRSRFVKMAYDPVRHVTVLFGGGLDEFGAGASRETWEYNGVDWTQVATANAPTGSLCPMMTFDQTLDKVLLFGGAPSVAGPYKNETWAFEGTDWTQITTAHAPSPRAVGCLVYDTNAGRSLLFGGGLYPNVYNDTWAFNGTDWQEIPISIPPEPRWGAGEAWDPYRNRMMIYGGMNYNGDVPPDTWEFDGTSWTRVVSPCPMGRIDFVVMAFHEATGVAVLYNPHPSLSYPRDTWLYGFADTDGDGMPDGWERSHGLDPENPADAVADADSDGLTNLQEYELGTDPHDSDSDDDGLLDGAEHNTYGTNPAQADSDGDGLSDGLEVNTYHTNPTDADTDDDGLPDGYEVNNTLNPLVDDSAGDKDSDGLSNAEEYEHGTNPTVNDTDGDGLNDGPEVHTYSTNPLEADSDRDGLSDGTEVNTTHTDPNNPDTDGDGIEDAVDPRPTVSDSPWQRLESSTEPTASEYAAMVYDSAREVIVMWGDPGNTRSTWEFDGLDWHEVVTASAPPKPEFCAMAYDPERHVTVVFGGGHDPYGSDASSQTWEYDGANWRQVATAHAPSGRLAPMMTYDVSLHKTLLFGGTTNGMNSAQYKNETWTYDGTDWAQISTAHAPDARAAGCLAFDTVAHRALLFGGARVFTPYNDTWAFDGTDWTLVTTAASPEARWFFGAAWDTGRGRLVVYGGDGSFFPRPPAATWEFDGTDWTRVISLCPMGQGGWPIMAYHAGIGLTVLYGMHPLSDHPRDTWLYGLSDTDGDGMPDAWESRYGLNPDNPADAAGDLDSDGLTNLEEYDANSLPNDPDTDDDGLTDGQEVHTYLTNPGLADTDRDGLSDSQEILTYGTDPTKDDTDGDYLVDGDEISHGTDPLQIDTDGDTFNDRLEIYYDTDPLDPNVPAQPRRKFAIGGIEPLFSDSSLNVYFPVWSSDGRRIAYIVRNKLSGDTDVYVTKLEGLYKSKTMGAPMETLRITAPGELQGWQALAWAPDGSALLFAGPDGHIIRKSSLGDGVTFGTIPTPHGLDIGIHTTSLPSGNRMIIGSAGRLYVYQISPAAGVISGPTLVYVPGPSEEARFVRLNADGTKAVFNIRPDYDDKKGDIYALDLTGGLPANGIADGMSRGIIWPVENKINYAQCPSFTNDGSFVIWSEDVAGEFVEPIQPSQLPYTNFDVMIRSSDGSGIPQQMLFPVDDGQIHTSPGGLRMSYTRNWELYAVTLMMTQLVEGAYDSINNNVTTDTEQVVEDGSGTELDIPQNVVIDFPEGVDPVITMETPIAPVDPVQLPPGVDGVPVTRTFGPSGTTFSEPIAVTITYTDAEIAGMDEPTLRVFVYNPGSGVFDQEISGSDIVSRDLAHNAITFRVDHFSTFGLAASRDTDKDGIVDSVDPDDDNDGIPDGVDPMPLDTDNDGFNNDVDPDDDSDGIADADEPGREFDTDNDGVPNAVDLDDDNDGIPDDEEETMSDRYDTDNDGQRNDVDLDDDGDGVPDVREDLDHDGVWDPGLETDLLNPDTDGDGYSDGLEMALGSDPLDPSTEMPVTGIGVLAAEFGLLLLLAAWRCRKRDKPDTTNT